MALTEEQVTSLMIVTDDSFINVLNLLYACVSGSAKK